MRTHNIGFYEDLTKISLNYHQISSNTHLISSAELGDPIGWANNALNIWRNLHDTIPLLSTRTGSPLNNTVPLSIFEAELMI